MARVARALVLIGLVMAAATAQTGQQAAGSVQQLLNDLKGADYEKAWRAAQELDKFHQQRAQIVPALTEALQREWGQCSGDIREAAAVSLGKLAGKEAVFPLLQLLQSGKNISHECAECGCCFLALTPADVLSERSFDPFCEHRVLATIHEYADFSHSKAMADLVTAGRWKRELLVTIGKVGLPRYANFIGRYKDYLDPEVRAAVAVGLGLSENDQVAVPVLLQLLSRGNEEFSVRWEAGNSLIAIGKRGKAYVRGRLADLLRERDPLVVVLAARALAALGEPAGVQKLREMSGNTDARLREEALLALGYVGAPEAGPTAVARLDDENLAVRAAAMYALAATRDPAVIPTLARALDAALERQAELEARLKAGASEAALRQQYGYGTYDLRQTHQEALEALRRPKP